MIICYTVPEIWHMVDVIVTYNFGLFFAFLPPKQPEKRKLKKKKKRKKALRYHHLTQVN